MKQKILIGCFLSFIFGILLLNFVCPDQTLSKTERRKLSTLPSFSLETFFSGNFGNQFETYLLDQFPFRETFRSVNAFTDINIFQRLETNDIYFNQHHAFKKEAALDESQVIYAANKLNEVTQRYLQGMNVYYGIIPEKNGFDEQNSIPKRNHEQLVQIFRDQLTSLHEIDFSHLLSLDHYYFSDPHWKQEKIYPIAWEIAKQMGNESRMVPFDDYEFKTLEPFYGAYYGQAALPMEHDRIQLALSDEIKRARVTGLEFEGNKSVYDEALFTGMDSYDVYLSGPQAFLEIELEDAQSDKELIIFRDSFGSSLAPYFIGAYKKITLVDLRYISANLLGDVMEFQNQDVLFLYSTSVLNNGRILK